MNIAAPRTGTDAYRIMIVEDEVLISDATARHLQRAGHVIVGQPISYAEAVRLYPSSLPELVLIDIRLSGQRTGIDLGHFLRRQQRPPAFIYLSSQTDQRYLRLARATFPSGYLVKPVPEATLHTTIDVVMHAHRHPAAADERITLQNGAASVVVPLAEVAYAEADHVYTSVFLTDGTSLVQRKPLKELIRGLPSDRFLRIHRSYLVNVDQVTRWDNSSLWVGDRELPIGRRRRPDVLARLVG